MVVGGGGEGKAASMLGASLGFIRAGRMKDLEVSKVRAKGSSVDCCFTLWARSRVKHLSAGVASGRLSNSQTDIAINACESQHISSIRTYVVLYGIVPEGRKELNLADWASDVPSLDGRLQARLGGGSGVHTSRAAMLGLGFWVAHGFIHLLPAFFICRKIRPPKKLLQRSRSSHL